MNHFVTQLINHGGLLAVFILMAAESCGIPFPSELIMPFAGAFAAGAIVSNSSLSLGGVILAGAAGNLGGSLVAYVLAARYGEPLLLGPGRRIGIRQSHVELADHWFQRYGLLAVGGGRLLPVIRTYISFPAGLAGVEPIRFSLLTFFGALPWCAALAFGGYKVGQNYDSIAKPIELLAVVLAVIVAIVLALWFMRGRTDR